MLIYFAVINEPDDVTICEGREAVFTCVLDSNIRCNDVQWYRFIKDTSTTEMIDPNGENIYFVTDTIGNTTSSSLTINNAIKSYTGYFWVGIPSLNVCNASLTVLTSMCVHSDYIILYMCEQIPYRQKRWRQKVLANCMQFASHFSTFASR